MSEAKKSNGNKIVRLTLILFLVSAIVALLLGLVNYVTADKIAAIEKATLDAAMQQVLPADSYDKVDYQGTDTAVNSVYSAGDKGYVVDVSETGSQGIIELIVGIDPSGAITGISLIKSSETSGLGAIAASTGADGEAFRAQFVGKTSVAVTKDGGDIDALTGATITSRAVCTGVNAALEAVKTVG